MRSGCCTEMPKRFAASFAGDGNFLRPRPWRRSGRVSRNSMSCRAASPSSTAAPNGAVAATASFTRLPEVAERRLRPELGERRAPLFGRRPVDREDPVEMVELVLKDACLEPLRLDPHRLARR